jgi:hypothetical protein
VTTLRLAALGTAADVRSSGPGLRACAAALESLAAALRATLSPVPDDEPPTLTVSGAPGAWRVDGEVLAGLGEDGYGTATDLPPLLLAALTRALLTSTPLLGIHAGVVEGPDGLVVVPGESGHGKTTLVAALVQQGWGYVSDEVLALDRVSGTVSAFARPLSLGPESWRLLGLDPASVPEPGGESLVALEQLGTAGAPGAVAHVLLTRRRPGPVTVAAGSRGQAVAGLLASAFNHYVAPQPSLQAVLALVRSAQVWEVGYQDATELAELLCRNGSQDWVATSAR